MESVSQDSDESSHCRSTQLSYSSLSSSLLFSSLSSDSGTGRCVGRVGRVWRTGCNTKHIRFCHESSLKFIAASWQLELHLGN